MERAMPLEAAGVRGVADDLPRRGGLHRRSPLAEVSPPSGIPGGRCRRRTWRSCGGCLREGVNVSGIGVVPDFAHPDVEVARRTGQRAPYSGAVSRSRSSLVNGWRPSSGSRLEPERFVDPGGQRVLVYVRDKGRIRGSDTEINTHLMHVWTLTDRQDQQVGGLRRRDAGPGSRGVAGAGPLVRSKKNSQTLAGQ